MTSLKNPNFIFIIFSLLIAILGFVKTIIFAKYLPLESLGLLALFQSVMALFGIFHFGILSGGYRLSSFYDEEKFKQLNSVVYLLLILLFTVFAIVILLLEIFGVLGAESRLVYIGFAAGFISLLSNWSINLSIARGNLKYVNIAQLSGAVASLFSVIFIFKFGLVAAYISVIIQPLIITICLVKLVDYTLPNALRYDAELVLAIFKSGFFPFLAGLFFISYQQLEKILIGYSINVEALGQLTVFYLVFTVWSIIPDSLNKILYPKLTLLMEGGGYLKSKNILLKHFFLIMLYSMACSFLLLMFLQPLADIFLPQHKEFVKYVHAGLLVYIFKSLCETPSIYLMSLGENNKILLADFLCFFSYIIFFVLLILLFEQTVELFIILASLYFVLKFIVLLFFSVNVYLRRYVVSV